MRPIILMLAALAAAPALAARAPHAPRTGHAHRAAPAFTAAAANDASRSPRLAKGAAGSPVLRLQVLLDRAHFSVGEIDGRYGGNTRRAVRAFREARGLPPGEVTDRAVWRALSADTAPVVQPYTLTAEDLAGPFAPIPSEPADQAALPALSWTSPMEMLGERFHASPSLLAALTPHAPLEPGTTLQVPAVARPPLPRIAAVRVSESDGSVAALDAAGQLAAWYPATVGSEHDPLPLGTWKINGVSRNPKFHFDPELFWDAEPGDKKLTLPPGPNGPVGVVWIDLSKPHYGIHGSPEPALVGHTASHGCIRLTNWDATELADAVAPGVRAELVK